VVPVHNGAATLRSALEALQSAPGPRRELIVVDDGSTDSSAAIAESMGLRVVRHAQRRGCGEARNTGVKYTAAQILVFVDSDIAIAPDALERIVSFMAENPSYAAVFGSYDSKPGDPGFVSQYRNLLHRFIHQNGKRDAETFWTGLGAVRRAAFQSVGGFRQNNSPIPDVMLGLDLSDAAFRIRIDPDLVGKHLKPWSMRTMVTTDVFLRAVPWTLIILARGQFTNDLNTTLRYRIGVALANVAVASLLMAVFIPPLVVIAVLALFATLFANSQLLGQFWKERGPLFTVRVVPLHIVHQLCCSAGFAIGLTRHFLGAAPSHLGRRHFNVKAQGLALDQRLPASVAHAMIVNNDR
jgi:cellulose synthase/poly-beta-1,6-N-acetylglucosamine synthase-like glycosyltransferase